MACTAAPAPKIRFLSPKKLDNQYIVNIYYIVSYCIIVSIRNMLCVISFIKISIGIIKCINCIIGVMYVSIVISISMNLTSKNLGLNACFGP